MAAPPPWTSEAEWTQLRTSDARRVGVGALRRTSLALGEFDVLAEQGQDLRGHLQEQELEAGLGDAQAGARGARRVARRHEARLGEEVRHP